MKKLFALISLLFCSGASLFAQQLTADYITWPGSSELPSYIQAWNGGSGTITIDGKEWEDHEFFVSRVKPRTRISNRSSQVYNTITDQNDKRCVFWVPVGNHAPDGSLHTNAFPNGNMDNEAFSMWSYIDHYGNWTSPFGWCPASFSDVAHKNGVAVSGVASVPNRGIPDDWADCFNTMGSLSAETLGKFFLYHGVDGLGYNSEWSSGSDVMNKIMNTHNGLRDYMVGKNPVWENIWYGGTSDSGSISFDQGLNYSRGLFAGASIFLNYNWNNNNTWNAVSTAEGMGKSPFYLYAGMNMQGQESTSHYNYAILKDYKISIGLWGAHDYNMFWQGRNSEGSSPETMQRIYLNTCEQWFGNGPRNPAIRIPTNNNSGHHPTDDWAGFSSMMSARSAINHVIKNEPFYTYFNLGNGKFFNYKGERMNDNEWYNIGIQDFLPTWRWWFAPTFMDGDVSASEVNLAADFTWDDAYFGGSCLQITGTDTDEYLHLFKTNIEVATGQRITVRYKLLEGEADVSLVYSAGNTPKTAAVTRKFINAADATTIQDKSYDEGWQTFTLPLTGTYYTTVNNAKGNIGVIALRFQNAKNLRLLLGELSITAAANTTTPTAPVIVKSKVLSNNYAGVDGKIIWKMPNSKAVGEPVYNSDVNTSMFKIYAREEGDEAQFLGVTTSWAAIGFRAPNTDASKRIQYGVSAVSADMKTESDIAWGDLLNKGEYVVSNEISISKTTIKPNEEFSISYIDSRHPESSWTLVNAAGVTVAEDSGLGIDVPNGLPDVGGYDLYIDRGTANERLYAYYVQVSGEGVGAIPEIYTLTHGSNNVDESMSPIQISLEDTQALSYTGRKANGAVSRGIYLNEKMVGASVKDLGIQPQTSFSIALWVRFDEFPADKITNFFAICNRGGAWPQSHWGWLWSEITDQGVPGLVFRGAAADAGAPGPVVYTFPETKFQPNTWTHIALTVEYASAGFRSHLFVNGVKQKSVWSQTESGKVSTYKYNNMSEDDYSAVQNLAIANTDDICFGGVKYQGAAFDGIVDDFQVWSKALTESDVRQIMTGLNENSLPADLMCLWDFESEPQSDNTFASKGAKAGVKGYYFDYASATTTAHGIKDPLQPLFETGSPFVPGSTFEIVTTANWKDSDRKTSFAKSTATTEDVAGLASAKFANPGDHTVSLTLKNNYGEDTKSFPVFTVEELSAIDGIVADEAGVEAYAIDDVLFVEFVNSGCYNVEVYNTSGMIVAQKELEAVAGQNARISLGVSGVYIVKVCCNGQVLRTIKVLNK